MPHARRTDIKLIGRFQLGRHLHLAQGRFDRSDFIYIQKDDQYECPAGERAIYRFTREENGLQMRRYWSSACTQCSIKSKCTPSDYRRISRWEHEDVVERTQQRLDQMPDAMM